MGRGSGAPQRVDAGGQQRGAEDRVPQVGQATMPGDDEAVTEAGIRRVIHFTMLAPKRLRVVVKHGIERR